MSTTSEEKVSKTLVGSFSIIVGEMRVKVPQVDLATDSKIRQRLREYVDYWKGKTFGPISAAEMERRAKKLGLNKGVSDATITNILSGKDFKMGLPTIRNLALLLGRPPEELFLIAIGREPQSMNGDGVQQQLASINELFPTLGKQQQQFVRMTLEGLIKQLNAPD